MPIRFTPDLRHQHCRSAVTLIGIPAATLVARASGQRQTLARRHRRSRRTNDRLHRRAVNWRCLLAGLILFRAFDITKPFPIRRLERLPEGTGIMLDDVGAGLYAFAVMQLLLHFNVLK